MPLHGGGDAISLQACGSSKPVFQAYPNQVGDHSVGRGADSLVELLKQQNLLCDFIFEA